MIIIHVTPKKIRRIIWHVVAGISVLMLVWKLVSLI